MGCCCDDSEFDPGSYRELDTEDDDDDNDDVSYGSRLAFKCKSNCSVMLEMPCCLLKHWLVQMGKFLHKCSETLCRMSAANFSTTRGVIQLQRSRQVMPIRIPFPLSLSVGTDIIAYNRLLKPDVAQGFLQRLARRFLHPYELSELDVRFPNWKSFTKLQPNDQFKLRTYLAGRWAAKEAAKKAWGATLISWKDLRVESLPHGEVQIVCQSYREPSSSLDDREDGSVPLEQVAKLSISHDGNYAVATVIASPLHSEILQDLHRRKAFAATKVAGNKEVEILEETNKQNR